MPKYTVIINPFKFGKPVTGEFFCNRTLELARLQQLFQSRNSGWLYSPRRYGKTSLIKEAFFLAEQEGIHTAYVDLLGLQAGLSMAELYLRGIGPLIAELAGGMEKMLQVVSGFVKSFVPTVSLDDQGSPVLSVATTARQQGMEPDLEELIDLPEKLARKTGSTVIIAIDEFQEINHTKGLESRLRSSMQQHENVNYLMAGSRASLLKDLFTSPERPFFQFAEHIPIEKISPDDLYLYLRGRFEYTDVDLGKTTIMKLVEMADCHPHFVQYFASVAWNIRREGRPDNKNFIPLVIDRIVSSLDPGFRMFFDSLASSNQRILAHIAHNNGELLLSEGIRRRSRLGSASTVSTALRALEKKEVLSRTNNEWQFVNPGLGLWVKERVAGIHS